MKYPKPFVEPTARRIRVRFDGDMVADSRRAQLLAEFRGEDALPTYYLPREDVRPGVLADRDADGRWAVVTKGGRVERAAWEHPHPTGMYAPLAGHVTFSWRLLDWYEEDEQVFVHARTPNHRVDALRSSRLVEVFVAGERVARSVRPVLLFETTLPTRYYLPFADVRADLLEPSDTVTQCPFKGVARYWSLRVGDTVVPDAVWSYPDPIPNGPAVRDLVCFFNERVDLVIDGEPQERPDTPWS